MKFKTGQEEFWAGEFGNDYLERNQGASSVSSNIALFSRILSRTSHVSSVIEFGANIGLNLIGIKNLLPNVELSAIEINKKAITQLEKLENLKIYPISILNFIPNKTRDLVLIKGVLIHINPKELQNVYELLYKTSPRYICIIEYYNPFPLEVVYCGQKEKLLKRDFAGEFLDKFNNAQLIDYGFIYHRDANFPQDDITWFLLEKKS